MLSDHPVMPILLSKDLAASRAFYEGLLGLEVIAENADRFIVRCGHGTQIAISRSTVGTSDPQTQIAWITSDLRREVDELRARGVRIEEYEAPDPVTRDGIADMGHALAAWFIDPYDNCLSVIQPKPRP